MIPALVGLGLGAYGAYQGAKQQKKADGLNDRALAMSEQQYADRAPFREYAQQGLSQMGSRDSSGIFGDPGNPYAAARDYTTDMGAQSFTPSPVNPQAGEQATFNNAVAGLRSGDLLGSTPQRLRNSVADQLTARRPAAGAPAAPPSLPASQPQTAGDPQSMRRAMFLQMLQQGQGRV